MTKRTTGICAALGAVAAASALQAAQPAISDATAAEIRLMDLDRDGKLSAAEHAAGTKRMFGRMDLDGNGTVTVAEMDKTPITLPGVKPDPDAPSSAEKIKVIDTNKDGSLSAEEHVQGSAAMFVRMDRDKDGFLTPAELERGRSLLRKR